MLKNRAMDRGFKVNLPYGLKNLTIYFNCSHYKAPKPGYDEPVPETERSGRGGKGAKAKQCPFSLIIKKH